MMIFLPWYNERRASTFGLIPGRWLSNEKSARVRNQHLEGDRFSYSPVNLDSPRINTNRAMHDLHDLSTNVHSAPAHRALVPTDSNAAAGKVAAVRVSLEADQVGAQHAVEDLLAFWQASEDFGGREGSVDEQADVCVWCEVAEVLRCEEEMVILIEEEISSTVFRKKRDGGWETNLDPDQVTRLVDLEKLLSVFQVGLGVSVEFGFVGLNFGCDVLPEEVVEERPQRCLRVRWERDQQKSVRG